MPVDFQIIVGWLRRLVSLDIRVFDDVRTNPGATIPGVIIVAVAMFLSGLGGWIWWIEQDFGKGGTVFFHSAVVGSIFAILLWGIAWLGVAYVMLHQIFRERVYLEQLLRVMGLAAAPLALSFFIVIPELSFGIAIGALILTFGVTTIAIQSATTADGLKVLIANAAGFALWALVLTLLAGSKPNTAHAPGIFLYNTVASAEHNLASTVSNINNVVP